MRALPHRTQELSQVSLGTRGAFSQSLRPPCPSSCPLFLSASGSGFPIHDTWPLSATETNEGLLVSKFHILGTANLIGHPSPLCGQVGRVTWPSTHLGEAEGADSEHRHRLKVSER